MYYFYKKHILFQRRILFSSVKTLFWQCNNFILMRKDSNSNAIFLPSLNTTTIITLAKICLGNVGKKSFLKANIMFNTNEVILLAKWRHNSIVLTKEWRCLPWKCFSLIESNTAHTTSNQNLFSWSVEGDVAFPLTLESINTWAIRIISLLADTSFHQRLCFLKVQCQSSSM